VDQKIVIRSGWLLDIIHLWIAFSIDAVQKEEQQNKQ
jgi:hypothetical protein